MPSPSIPLITPNVAPYITPFKEFRSLLLKALSFGLRILGLGLWGSGLRFYVSKNLNSLKGVIWGTKFGLLKGDTRSLDYVSHGILNNDKSAIRKA